MINKINIFPYNLFYTLSRPASSSELFKQTNVFFWNNKEVQKNCVNSKIRNISVNLSPANIYLFKVNKETLEKGVKHIQS